MCIRDRSQVYAASDKENRSADAWTDLGNVEYDLPTGIAGMVTSVAAVSYTHLDVYKRQE